MQLVLPRLDLDYLRTTEDWTVKIEPESRNKSMFEHHGMPCGTSWSIPHQAFHAVIKAGALLTISRYYIRKGGRAYDSVTFLVHELDGVKLKKKLRFWCSIDHAQNMKFEFE